MTNPSEEKTVDAPKVEKPAKAEKKVNPDWDESITSLVAHYGEGVAADLVRIKALTDEYEALTFDPHRATVSEVTENFDKLTRLYNAVLSVDPSSVIASIAYFTNRFAAGRFKAFSPYRINMIPASVKGSSQGPKLYVGDLNQLFANLAQCATATELRSKVRLGIILKSVPSEKQRRAIETYVASIDY